MAVPVWPSGVPYKQLRDGAATSSLFVPPAEAETEGGIGIARPRSGPRSTEIAWRSLDMTSEQYEIFDDWALNDLAQATKVFEMAVYKPGSGYVSRRCKIKGAAISVDMSRGHWISVSFSLIIFNW